MAQHRGQGESGTDMLSDRKKLEDETLEQLADRMQDGPSAGRHYYTAAAELDLRKARWQIESSKAQQEAANAAKETAEYTRQNARYMLWSVIAILVILGTAFLFQILTWAFQR